ncbi:histidine kinase [Chryseobacterium koreense CCUG 49689]|uniref:histidine kinase n=2 Tax=Chryseobacterium koreense TaxID=232216 RepID=A0A0J7IXD9_9FLAO|nr:histidine kinase [Chryseobacterium koreense CCUG 49689]
MTLRKRFILISSLSFGIVTIITFVVVFLGYYDSSKQVYMDKLQNKALVSAIYYLEKDELPKERHAEIKKEYNRLISRDNVAVYNDRNQVTFGGNKLDPNIKNPLHLDLVRKNKRLEFMSGDFFYYGIFYKDNQGNFVVFVKNSNSSFKDEMFRLSVIMISALVLGLLVIFFLSMYLSKIAYRPISKVVEKVNNADYTDISKAITSTNTNDEIEELIKSYNKLLARISENIMVQQNFINYVSHEFKTPLAAISGSLEVFAQKDRTPEDYRKVVADSLINVYQIESILSNLLLMSGLTKIEKKHSLLRIDEIIWNIYEKLTQKAAEFRTQIDVRLEVENPGKLQFPGNETLLYLAFYNIIENAIKYSDEKPIAIIIAENNNHLEVSILDHGKGISKEDLPQIWETFYRGHNVAHIKGSGIGLSLSKNIFEHHHITMDLQSQLNRGTRVTLTFP